MYTSPGEKSWTRVRQDVFRTGAVPAFLGQIRILEGHSGMKGWRVNLGQVLEIDAIGGTNVPAVDYRG